jgi:hypothetical protein
MNKNNSNIKMLKALCVLVFAVFIFTGCGTIKVAGDFKGMNLAPETKVEVGKIVNQGNAKEFDDEVQQICKNSLINKFQKEKILWASDTGGIKAILDIYLIEYQKGDAFKRWLLPGWGATVVTLKAEFKDEKGNTLGIIDCHRTVEAGGGYTIGAWKTIFNDVADDIYEQFKEKGLKQPEAKKP